MAKGGETGPVNLAQCPILHATGVGPERAAAFSRLGIASVEDLLLHRPRRYEDRRLFRTIRELQPGQAAITKGTIIALGVKRWKRGLKSVFEMIVHDGTGR